MLTDAAEQVGQVGVGVEAVQPKEVILSMGWMPRIMEHFGASPHYTAAASREVIAQCQLVLSLIAFLQRLGKDAGQKLFLIVDNLKAHHDTKVKRESLTDSGLSHPALKQIPR